MIMSVLRGQISLLMSAYHVTRTPFLRRFNGEDHLFISDLPVCITAEEMSAFSRKAISGGWNVLSEGDYVYLDPVEMPPLPNVERVDLTEEEECCLFLLSEHPSDDTSYSEIIEYLKASEQGASKKTLLLLKWQRIWAERIRMHQSLPGYDLYAVILYDQ